MSSEETLIQTRKNKHHQINDGKYVLAENPDILPFIKFIDIQGFIGIMDSLEKENRLLTSINPQELQSSGKFTIRGRIGALRKSGSITFIKVTDMTGSMQVIVSKAAYGDARYEELKLLDFGDIVEIGGYPCLSKTGERSLLAFGIRLLTKAHRPPPEKFAGIADPELKYRKRYLDLMSSEESRARFIVRTHIIRAIREFMEERNFLEVETSTLNTVATGANAKPFVTHHNALDIPLRLRIAPELYLKRLLVGGMDRVFEIGRNYRNEGIDTRHNPEFTMMESYEAYGKFSSLIVFTKSLLRDVDRILERDLPKNVLPFYQQWREARTFSWSHFQEITMLRAVENGMRKAELGVLDGYNLDHSGPVNKIIVHNHKNDRLQKIDLKTMLHVCNSCTSTGEQIASLFEYVAEPFLSEDYRFDEGKRSCPVFITEYPKVISPLARSIDHFPDVAERFELFVEGRELANAFQELNDPDEQALRFKEQLSGNGKDPMDFDADYVEALEYGMPPAVGFGIGIDRLVMLLTNATSIKDVILFPTLRPEK